MRLSSISLAAVLLLSPVALAQHGGGGGGGGGSHGGSSGGGGYSGGGGSGGHSSGGSSFHGSGGSSGHGSNSGSAHSTPRSTTAVSRHQPGFSKEAHESLTKTQHERRDLVSLLRHPFKKHHAEAAFDLRRHLCLSGSCAVCPVGQVRAGGVCTTPRIVYQNNKNVCSHWDLWVGDPCLANTRFVDDCGTLRTILQQQAARMDAAEIDRRRACLANATECSDLTNGFQSEANLYREMQARFVQCRQHPAAVSPFGDPAQTNMRTPLFEPR